MLAFNIVWKNGNQAKEFCWGLQAFLKFKVVGGIVKMASISMCMANYHWQTFYYY